MSIRSTAAILLLAAGLSLAGVARAADVLLVDDDGPSTVRAFYTDALDRLGVRYEVFDTGGSDAAEPAAQALAGHRMVLWFSGSAIGGAGPGAGSQSALAAWLDGGGCLALSAQDYFWDKGGATGAGNPAQLDAFMRDYLGIGAAINDVAQTRATGVGPTRPYTVATRSGARDEAAPPGGFVLDFAAVAPTFPNYSDALTPAAGDARAFVAMAGDAGALAVAKRTPVFRTVTLAFPLEALPGAAARAAIIDRLLGFCGVRRAVLLVDDDGAAPGTAGDVAAAYSAALTGIGLEPAVHDASAGEPTLAELSRFTDVVWAGGRSGTLDDDGDTLGTWLPGGGALAMFGPAVMDGLRFAGPLPGFLGVESAASSSCFDLYSAAGIGVFRALGAHVLGGCAALGLLEPGPGAARVLAIPGEGTVGVQRSSRDVDHGGVVHNHAYRSAFFSVSIEDFEDPAARRALLGLALDEGFDLDYAFGKPALTSHRDGDALAGAAEQFRWDGNGVPADGWALWFGSTPGGREYGFALSEDGADDGLAFDGLPVSGETVHLTLWWRVAGRWSAPHSRRYTFTGGRLPVIVSHADDREPATPLLPGDTVTWAANGVDADGWALWFGSTPGGREYGFSVAETGAETSLPVSDRVPANGEMVHVTLWWRVAGRWDATRSRRHVFPAGERPHLVSPAAGGALQAPSAVFSWQAGDVAHADGWALWFGSTPGGREYGFAVTGDGGDRQLGFDRLPVDGQTVHVTLWWRIAGGWSAQRSRRYAFTAGRMPELVLSSELLDGPSQTFRWDPHAVAAERWALWFGSSPRGREYGSVVSADGGAAPLAFDGLPIDGETVHVTLWWQVGGTWNPTRSREYTLRAASYPLPEITFPPPGSGLRKSETFLLKAHGVPVDGWALWFGSTPGGRDHGFAVNESGGDGAIDYTRLPTGGGTVHVTLWWRLGGRWNAARSRPYVYAASRLLPQLSAPSQFDGSGRFTGGKMAQSADGRYLLSWDWGDIVADGWSLSLGRAPNGRDLGVWQSATASPSGETVEVTDLPPGMLVHATLRWRVGGRWSAARSMPYTVTTGRFTPSPRLILADRAGDGITDGEIGGEAALLGTRVTFTWDDDGLVAEDHAIWFGKTPGGREYGYAWASEVNPALPRAVGRLTFDGLPGGGERVYATFWWKVDGVWASRLYALRAITLDPHGPGPRLVTPESAVDDDARITAGERLDAGTATFAWDDGGLMPPSHAVSLGSSPGAQDLGFALDPGNTDSLTVRGLPMDGRTLHATFLWQVGGVDPGDTGTYRARGYTFTAPRIDLDLLTAAATGNRIWRNAGDGGLTGPASLFASTSGVLALGDLDGDGDLDAVLGGAGASTAGVGFNDGQGGFTPGGGLSASTSTKALALGDLDGDGDLDAFALDDDGAKPRVWRNGGAGAFTEGPALAADAGIRAMALGDLDGDGDLDVFLARSGNDTVLRNDGNAGFGSPTVPPGGAAASLLVVLGDLDGDGDLDAVVAYDGAPPRVLRNEGGAAFSLGQTLTDAGNAVVMALGDLDADGDLDLLTADADVGAGVTLRPMINDGAGAFSVGPSAGFNGFGQFLAIALGDLDGDGDLDAVATVPAGVFVLRNEGRTGFRTDLTVYSAPGARPALGDIDGDGSVPAAGPDGLPNINPGLLPSMRSTP